MDDEDKLYLSDLDEDFDEDDDADLCCGDHNFCEECGGCIYCECDCPEDYDA
jgi:hypothetical protein